MTSLRKNYILSLISQMVTVICPLIVTPFVARRLLADNIGIFSFTESIVFIFSLFALLGSQTHGQREIAYCQGNKRKQLQTFAEIFLASGITTSIVLAGYIVYTLLQTKYQLIYWIQVLELIAFHWNIGWFYQGKEDFKSLLYRNFLVKMLYIILIFSFIRSPEDLPLYVLFRVGTFLVGGATLLCPVFFQCWKEKIRVSFSAVPYHIKKMIPLFIPQIAIQIYTVLDKTMIGVITQSPYQNGCYEEAMKVIRVLMNFVGAAAGVLLPRIASLHAAGNTEEIRKKLSMGIRFVCLITLPMIAGVIIVAPIFMPWFLGPGFDDAVILLQTLSILLLLIGLSGLFGNGTLLACGKEKQYTLCIICGAIVNFALNCILISAMNAKGAAIASVAAEAVVTITMFYCIRDKISGSDLLIDFIKYLIASSIMTVILLVAIKYIQCPAFFKLAIVIPVGMLTYGFVLLILKDRLIFDIILKIKQKILKSRRTE